MIQAVVKFLMKRTLKDQRHPSRVYRDHLQAIAIVATSEPEADLQTALKLRSDLRQRGLRVVDLFVSYPSKKSLNRNNERDWTAFTSSSFNWIGRVVAPELSQHLKTDYELLIDLTEGRSFAADVLIAKLSAKWKVGRHTESREYLLDLMIDAKDQDLKYLIHHIEHYLQTLNKSNAA